MAIGSIRRRVMSRTVPSTIGVPLPSVCCRPMTVHLRVDEDAERFEVDVEPESD